MTESTLVVQEQGGVAVVGFRDNAILDMIAIRQIGEELGALLESAGRARVVLDFGNVRFLSSQALGMLLTLRRKADAAGAQVVLSQLRPELFRVFKITNLDKMFAFFDDNAQALAHFGVKPDTE
jgi:anti-anti-sigma factor